VKFYLVAFSYAPWGRD